MNSGGALVHVPPHKMLEKQGPVTASSPLPVLAGVTCKIPKKTQQAIDFSFFSFVSDLRLFLSFSVSDRLLYRSVLFLFVSPSLFQMVGCMTKRAAGC
jgi:hypothetical protein